MSGDLAVQIGREALLVVIMVSAPTLVFGLVVGLAVAVFQATTQIQEQTLAFIPKILSVFVAILIFGPWMLNMMSSLLSGLLISIPVLIR
jgi:flagellar biosynthetic protein FliQ